MPKLKSHRGAAKRFKPTANGYKCAQSHHNHILTKNPCDVPAVERMLQGS